MEEKMPLSQKLCAFRCLNSRPQLRSRIQFKYFSDKLLLSQKLRYFRGYGIFYTINTELPITRYQVGIYAKDLFG